MQTIPYAFAVGSLMHAVLCTRSDICFRIGMVSGYQSNLEPEHWTTVKHKLKCFRRTMDYMLVLQSDELVPKESTGLDCQFNQDCHWSTSILYLPSVVRLLFGGVWINLALLTPLWKSSMLELLKQQRKSFGLGSSSWDLGPYLLLYNPWHYSVTTMD